MKKIKFKKYIAPWVLPNEEIPAHLIWDTDFDFNYIKIHLPDGILLKEILNVNRFKLKKNTAIFFKEEIKKVNFPNYFGFITIFTSAQSEELKIFRDIKVSIFKDEIPKFETILTAKIFRPKLIDRSQIEPITLNNETDKIYVPLNLQCIGFGYVDLTLKATINKIKFSMKKNLIERVRENLDKKYKIIDDLKETEIGEDKRDFVKKESINRFFTTLDEYIRLLRKSKDLESKEKFEKKITDFLSENDVESRYISDLFFELFTQIKIRNKFENVLMRDPYLEIPNEYFNEIVDNIIIYIAYKDLQDNEYNDLEIPISISDLRTEPQKTTIFFKVNIENIKNDTFQYIEKIKRD